MSKNQKIIFLVTDGELETLNFLLKKKKKIY